jgi:hypothetical protein
VYDDRADDYEQLGALSASATESGPPIPGGGSGGSGGGGTNSGSYGPPDYGTNLWLDITNHVTNSVSIVAHNVVLGKYFELLSRTNLVEELDWTIEQEVRLDGSGIEDRDLGTFPEEGRPQRFFWAAEADTRVWVVADNNAIRAGPCYAGQPGNFTVHRDGYFSGYGSPLTVYYHISGTATNGVDYSYLNGSVTTPATLYSWPIEVDSVVSLFGSNLTVTVTLVMTNGYLVDSNGPSATIVIEPNVFSQVATLQNPVGLDYHTLTRSLLASVDRDLSPNTNFVRIDTNGVVSHWADVTGLYRPVTIATVKTSTNGFVEGDMYFGTVDHLGFGWLSADGTRSDNNWASLTGYLAPVGGLYVDETGVFDGDLIAATGGDYTGAGDPGSVWRVSSSSNATPVADFSVSLGGIITLTNDVAQWGRWTGKIITGQGPETLLENPAIYAIDTNGQVETFHLGIQPEHFDLIPANQPFYCCDSTANALWKVPAAVFTNHVGQLLITGMGQAGYVPPPALFIVHRDAGITNFVIEKIATPDFVGCLEDGAFAPIDIPCLQQ